MEILIAYDVSTETLAGRRRLRKLAQICEAYGQRVQKSVFECLVDSAQFEQLQRQLQQGLKADEDSVRIYRLREPRDDYLVVLGVELEHDLHNPLII